MDRNASTLDGVRRRNLAIVLDHVHRHGPASRAAITAATGLNRSTVAALVAELESVGLVVEGDPLITSRVGRPSPLVSIGDESVAIAVNPEVDAITVGLVGLGGAVLAVSRHEVAGAVSAETAIEIIAAQVEGPLAAALAGRRLIGVGVAVPGLVRASDHVIRWAPHLGWREIPFGEWLEHRLGIPVSLANDATLGALAEHLFGAGRDIDDVVHLDGGGSGIGGGVIVGGEVVGGRAGYAGEFGQNRPGGADADRVTAGGVLEDEVNRGRLLGVLGLASTTDEAALRAAMLATTTPAVRAEIERQNRILGVALANAINVLNPTVVVLGGFLASLLAADEAGLSAAVAHSALEVSWEGTRLVPAALAEHRLLIGAAELAFAPLLADPAGFAGSPSA